MRTLKLALTAVAAFAFNANAATSSNGMGDNYAGGGLKPPEGVYQKPLVDNSQPDQTAFHAGGVAACDGCHVMHNANGGVAKSTAAGVPAWGNTTNMFLLQGSDQSSTCLICHSGVKANAGNGLDLEFTVADLSNAAPTNRTPAGDFGWLKQSFKNSPGYGHGHNVVAADFGLTNDSRLTAPGGTITFTASGKQAFGCASCHDPHGRYRMVTGGGANGIAFQGPLAANSLPIAASGSYGAEPKAGYAVGAYRILGGAGYAPASNASYPFPSDPPVAVAPLLYNATEATAEVRVAYGTGMSEWCSNCHTNIHFGSGTGAVGIAGFRHPAGSDATLRANQISIYNTYLSSGNIAPSMTDNYTSLVPFEQGKDKSIAALAAKTASGGTVAAEGSNVMCLSCHRAHASAFDSMVRWDQQATFLTDGSAFTNGATGSAFGGAGVARSGPQTTAGYYDRTVGPAAKNSPVIGPYQRSLCNKCHGKD